MPAYSRSNVTVYSPLGKSVAMQYIGSASYHREVESIRLEAERKEIEEREIIRRLEREEREKREIIRRLEYEEKNRGRICSVGVCKGLSWEDAKEFIIRTHPDGEKYWKEWIHRVSWEDAPPSVALVLVPLETPTNLMMEVETNNNNQTSRGFERCLTDVWLAMLIFSVSFSLLMCCL
jgi:hypothetical protein